MPAGSSSSIALISSLNQYTWWNGVEKEAILPARDLKKSATAKSGNLSALLSTKKPYKKRTEKMPIIYFDDSIAALSSMVRSAIARDKLLLPRQRY
ncbi:hypothetical protein B9T19_07410 [Ignatzschineria sp. F8392]|nr:hypothetical protein B9T19_07410 [Ignatzschineria sp. F8392]